MSHVVGHEDVADLGERLAVPRAAQDRVAGDGRVAALDAFRRAHGLVVRDVDPLVLREPRVKRDVHQAGHRAERHLGGVPATGDGSSLPSRTSRRRPWRSVIEDGAVREKRNAPRMRRALSSRRRRGGRAARSCRTGTGRRRAAGCSRARHADPKAPRPAGREPADTGTGAGRARQRWRQRTGVRTRRTEELFARSTSTGRS